MKKEIEFEPALRQVISQTFIDTPAPRKTRYRIIRPDLNTLKNAEDNLSIVLCVSERKTMPHPHFEVPVYQSYCKRTVPLYHALVMREEHRIAYRCIGLSIQCKYTNRF